MMEIGVKNITQRLMVIFLMFVIFCGMDFIFNNLGIGFHSIVSIMLTIVLIYIGTKSDLFCHYAIKLKLNISRIKIKPFYLLFLLPLFIKLVLAFVLRFEAGGDIINYISLANDYAKQGYIDGSLARLGMFAPHTFWFGVFLLPVSWIGVQYIIYEIYFAILTSTANLFLYYAIKRIYSSHSKALFVSLIYCYMPSSIFACLTVTHEIAFQFMFTYILWLVSFLYDNNIQFRKKIILDVLIGGGISIASLVNHMGIIYLMSYIVFCLLMNKNNIRRGMIRIIICLLTYTSIVLLADNFQIEVSRNVSESSVPRGSYSWPLYVGGNFETDGRYSERDFLYLQSETIKISGEDYTIEDMNHVAMILAYNRWCEDCSRLDRLINLFLVKFRIAWSGTHYSIEYVMHYVEKVPKPIYMVLMGINNIIYIILILWGLKGAMFYKDGDLLVCCLSIIVLVGTCILLVVEIMNKYNLSLLLPLYIVVTHYIYSNTELSGKIKK